VTERSKLLFTEVWSTTFVFQDIYNESNEEFKKYVDSLTDTQLEEFINENHHSWSNGFESGIMTNWDVVAQTVASNTNLPK
jgi:hypothetical protein